MKTMLNQDIIREATRLTRAGHLVEATALLQRMLRGESAPDAPSHASGRIALAGPLIIDAKANVEETETFQLVIRNQSQPHPHHHTCSGRYWIAKRGAPGSDCEA